MNGWMIVMLSAIAFVINGVAFSQTDNIVCGLLVPVNTGTLFYGWYKVGEEIEKRK